MVLDIMVLDTVGSMESVKLRLNPRLLLIPTFSMVDTMDMVLDTMDTDLDMDLDTMEMGSDTMGRDLLKPSPKLLLNPTCCTVDMVLDMPDTMDMDTHMLDMVTSDKLDLP